MTNVPLYNEKELLRLVADGDEAAFGTLFHTWRDKLYFFLLRLTGSPETSEDVLQDTFVKLWVNRATLGSVTNFGGYLYRMVRNQAISALQRMSLETLILADLRRDALHTSKAPDEALLQKQLEELLAKAIDSLPDQQKLVYNLVRIEGLHYDEVADRLHISVSTVKNHMSRALQTIRTQIGKKYSITNLYLLLLISLLEK